MPTTHTPAPQKTGAERGKHLSMNEAVQVHNWLMGQRNFLVSNPQTYDQLADAVQRQFGWYVTDNTLRKMLKSTGISVAKRTYGTSDSSKRTFSPEALERMRAAAANARRIRAERGGFSGMKRKLSEEQIQAIEKDFARSQSLGAKFDFNAHAAFYKVSKATINRVCAGTYRLVGNTGKHRRTSESSHINSNGDLSSPTAPTVHTPTPLLNQELLRLRKNLDALEGAHSTDRTILLRLVQENGVLAGLLRSVIDGIEGLYKGLGVDYMPKPQASSTGNQTDGPIAPKA